MIANLVDKALKNIYRIIMECAICFEEIKDHKLFKAGCCSINLCVDCVKASKLEKCPQCKKPYSWIAGKIIYTIDETNKKLQAEIQRLRGLEINLGNQVNFLQNVSDSLNREVADLKQESKIKGQYMNQMKNMIARLIQEKEDQECKKHLENRIQQALQKREEEQKQAHAAWLRKQKETKATNKQHKPDSTSIPTDKPNNTDRQPKTIHAFSLYQSHNMAVKNCINAMKTLAVFDSVIPEAELAFKLRLCYQEFLTDSRSPEQHVTRRPQTQYEPRHPTTTTHNRKRTREEEEEDKPPRHHNHTQNTPNKRPKPTTDGWNSPAPKDWREANRRHLEEARQKQQRQQHNDSDWE